MSRLVDLSHPIHDGMPAYPGLPAARVRAILDHRMSRERYDGKAEFHLGAVELAANTGTYVDVPFHRYRDGEDLSTVAVERLAGLDAVVVDAPATAGPVDVELDVAAVKSRAVLVRTGWDGRWGSDAYWKPGPFLSRAAVELLASAPAGLVGVDFANVDDTRDPARPAHTGLLGAGIPIVEHLTNLSTLPRSGSRFSAVPPAIAALGTFPVRAFAEIP